MKTRTLVAAVTLSALVLGSSFSAFAYPGGCANRADISSLTPEKQAAYKEMMEDHYKRMTPLRDKLEASRLELHALSQNPNTKPETLSQLAKDVAGMQSQMRAERKAFGDKMEKEFGIVPQPRKGDGPRHGQHNGHAQRMNMNGCN